MRPVERILVGIDFTDAGRSALLEAGLLSRTFGAALTLLHAPAGLTPRDDRRVLEHAERMVERWAAELQAGGARVSRPSHLAVGKSPDDALLAAIAEHDPDLVVIGAGERTRLGQVLFGSTAERVVRESRRPVWLARPGQDEPRVKRIVCAVDASDPAREALAAAAFLARTFVAELHTVSVVPAPEEEGAARAGSTTPRALGEALASIDLHGIDHRVVMRNGKPAAGIADAVADLGADLLVIGSARRRGLGRLVRGNTAEKVLRLVPCSTLTVPAQGDRA